MLMRRQRKVTNRGLLLSLLAACLVTTAAAIEDSATLGFAVNDPQCTIQQLFMFKTSAGVDASKFNSVLFDWAQTMSGELNLPTVSTGLQPPTFDVVFHEIIDNDDNFHFYFDGANCDWYQNLMDQVAHSHADFDNLQQYLGSHEINLDSYNAVPDPTSSASSTTATTTATTTTTIMSTSAFPTTTPDHTTLTETTTGSDASTTTATATDVTTVYSTSAVTATLATETTVAPGPTTNATDITTAATSPETTFVSPDTTTTMVPIISTVAPETTTTASTTTAATETSTTAPVTTATTEATTNEPVTTNTTAAETTSVAPLSITTAEPQPTSFAPNTTVTSIPETSTAAPVTTTGWIVSSTTADMATTTTSPTSSATSSTNATSTTSTSTSTSTTTSTTTTSVTTTTAAPLPDNARWFTLRFVGYFSGDANPPGIGAAAGDDNTTTSTSAVISTTTTSSTSASTSALTTTAKTDPCVVCSFYDLRETMSAKFGYYVPILAISAFGYNGTATSANFSFYGPEADKNAATFYYLSDAQKDSDYGVIGTLATAYSEGLLPVPVDPRPTTTAGPTGDDNGQRGTIIIVVIGCVAGIALVAAGLAYLIRRRKIALAASSNDYETESLQEYRQVSYY